MTMIMTMASVRVFVLFVYICLVCCLEMEGLHAQLTCPVITAVDQIINVDYKVGKAQAVIDCPGAVSVQFLFKANGSTSDTPVCPAADYPPPAAAGCHSANTCGGCVEQGPDFYVYRYQFQVDKTMLGGQVVAVMCPTSIKSCGAMKIETWPQTTLSEPGASSAKGGGRSSFRVSSFLSLFIGVSVLMGIIVFFVRAYLRANKLSRAARANAQRKRQASGGGQGKKGGKGQGKKDGKGKGKTGGKDKIGADGEGKGGPDGEGKGGPDGESTGKTDGKGQGETDVEGNVKTGLKGKGKTGGKGKGETGVEGNIQTDGKGKGKTGGKGKGETGVEGDVKTGGKGKGKTDREGKGKTGGDAIGKTYGEGEGEDKHGSSVWIGVASSVSSGSVDSSCALSSDESSLGTNLGNTSSNKAYSTTASETSGNMY